MTVSQRVVIAGLIGAAIVFTVWAVGGFDRSLTLFSGGEIAAPPRSNVDDSVGVVGIFVEPDDGRAPILTELAAAERTIDLAVYLLSDQEIINALIDAEARGVRVRVILEEHPFGGSGQNPVTFDRLQAAGAEVRWSNPAFRFSHVKMFVIDNDVAIIMNLNLSRSAFTDNRELAAITTRPPDVSHAAAIFGADWDREEEPTIGPLVVSPTNSRTVLLGLIDSADMTLDIYAEVMRDEDVIQGLTEAEGRGVRVRLVVSPDYGDDDRGETELNLLEREGVEVVYARGLYVHAKAIIVDGTQLWLGSQNFTATSLDQNREVGIVIDERANVQRAMRVFDEDFAAGRAA
jgi:cardiolipin synthase